MALRRQTPSKTFASGTLTAPTEPRGYAPQPAAVTVPRAAWLLHLDPRTVRAMVRAGELDGNRVGRAIRVSTASIAAWLRGPASARQPRA